MTKSFDASPASAPIDPLASANAAVAWVVVANKPFYPFAVWWFVGAGFEASLAVLIATTFYAAVPFLARRASLAARVATPPRAGCSGCRL